MPTHKHAKLEPCGELCPSAVNLELEDGKTSYVRTRSCDLWWSFDVVVRARNLSEVPSVTLRGRELRRSVRTLSG